MEKPLTIGTAAGLQIYLRDATPVCTGRRVPLEAAVVAVEVWIKSNPDHLRLEYAERWVEAAEVELAKRKPSPAELDSRRLCQIMRREVLKLFRGAGSKLPAPGRATVWDGYASVLRDEMIKRRLPDEHIDRILAEDFHLGH